MLLKLNKLVPSQRIEFNDGDSLRNSSADQYPVILNPGGVRNVRIDDLSIVSHLSCSQQALVQSLLAISVVSEALSNEALTIM